MRTVLLDLDGTLVDSAALITEHLSAALRTLGVARMPHELLPLVGPPFETALPALGLTAEQTATAIAAYRATYNPVAPTETPLYPGTVGILGRLGGLRLVVATSKPEEVARGIVEGVGIGGHFELVAGSAQPVGRVGKAAVIGSALTRLGLDPAREPVVMVGDRHHDVDGAAEFGIPTVGVAWGYALPGELSGAAKIVADADALVDALTGDAHWSSRP
ncbi:HAD hydrolase-like protein [Pseudonocardia abyssalis]|uniref:HAD hydrolase-like protein n=1 Tax=Pseudonocardia abyssalis TaxID=2792008 RepID=A0ABS6V1Y7_9PSEU|nr:HAD hydrolase-like protein [Pseudonocardia abyssalis]MBW0114215.1 HAD hydrolase-like protein [Pseudonocardia abyssalis]MBW0138480.1 HAD hydrolase-like protein [Pseudonocardia abyssalis]